MSHLASQLIAKIAHRLRQQLRSSICQPLILFLFVSLCFLLLDLFYFQFYHVQSVEDPVPVGSVLVYVVGGKHSPGSPDVVFDEVYHGKNESDPQEQGHQHSRAQNDDVS